jgi:hypothetical protein
VNTPYSGITIGDGAEPDPNGLGNNKIRFNEIHRVMLLMEDGAGIYMTSGQSPTRRFNDGLEVSGNYIYDVQRIGSKTIEPASAIYLDAGTDWTTIRDNVLEDVRSRVFLHTDPAYPVGDNNSYSNSDGTDARTANPDSSGAVVARSGLEDAYRGIKLAGYFAGYGPLLADARSAEAGASNLMDNGSFEIANERMSYPANWTEYKPSLNQREVGVAVSGDSSLKAVGPVDVYAQQPVRLKSNTRYRLWGYVKADNVTGTGIWLRYSELAPAIISHNGLLNSALTGTRDWTRLWTSFRTSGDYLDGRLDIMMQVDGGTAWIDDVVLCEKGSVGCP